MKKDFPFLFPTQFENQIWIDRLTDTIQNEIYNEVKKSFFDFSIQKNSLQDFYGNYLKYDSSYQIPRIITLTTDVDFRKKIILTDSLLLIGLDNYLGENHFFYSSFPKYIQSTFNNTIITITNVMGDTVSWASAGSSGFKGARKSTPFAAQTAAEKAALDALSTGMKNVEILVKGQGSGRETAIRAIEGAGFEIISIQDITAVPHNGCRPPKRRRV